ncbi:acetylornithine deacetylase ArgE domain protein [Mycobacterium xenopi 4042]|uniref:Acetylornithine deacetylase ArgE domain protein n=1 Tax=Mycobacterium xenopi 4042 TaxID=1299334 RepID=X8AN96_MYCXE|nr:acetylornithine deacetylase ArgE domain protein [Mycobacterium xenopi 4042]
MRLLASLHDDDGNVAIAGLHESTAAPVDYPPSGSGGDWPAGRGDRNRHRLRAATAMGQTGDYRDRHRYHIDCGVVEYVDPRARAKISMRVAPVVTPPRTLMRYAPISSSMRRGART